MLVTMSDKEKSSRERESRERRGTEDAGSEHNIGGRKREREIEREIWEMENSAGGAKDEEKPLEET